MRTTGETGQDRTDCAFGDSSIGSQKSSRSSFELSRAIPQRRSPACASAPAHPTDGQWTLSPQPEPLAALLRLPSVRVPLRRALTTNTTNTSPILLPTEHTSRSDAIPAGSNSGSQPKCRPLLATSPVSRLFSAWRSLGQCAQGPLLSRGKPMLAPSVTESLLIVDRR